MQGEGENASAGYHGYWITDFTRVDPHFGTNAELTKLIDKAHAKGMKVYFDVITNHTADTVDYAEKEYGYKPKGAFPYLDKDGRPFDDRDGMPRTGVDLDAFPYTPVAKGEKKVPAWLNDPAMYHNRGDSTFAGESGEYGDFFGLDDLWTERPEVVRGMEKIYQRWVKDFGIDGFRVDTVKHVDLDFWTQWATALDAYAAKRGRDDFFMFGEVYSADPAVTAPYVTRGRLDSTLDFPFQEAARSYASQGAEASTLSDVLAQDYRYTTDGANAYSQVTFLGNHDMGRIGSFLKKDNPEADGGELLRRAKLANELMFLTRGNPVVYYGDEQGFTGAGGDKDARQTLFASKTADYLDDDQLGTRRTHADDAYDPRHPLYRQIAGLSKLTGKHPALRDGIQTERLAGTSLYAFSRTDVREKTEYVVAFNNSTEARTAEIPTGSARMTFRTLHGSSGGSGGYDDADRVVSGADKKIEITVPALSTTVLKAAKPLPAPAAKPSVTLTAPEKGATGTVELTADVDGGQLNRVVFAAQTGRGSGGCSAAPTMPRTRSPTTSTTPSPPEPPCATRPSWWTARAARRAPSPPPPPGSPRARQAHRRRTGLRRRPLPPPRRRLRRLAAPGRRAHRRLHRPRRVRRLRLDHPGRGRGRERRRTEVHRREGRHRRRPRTHHRPGEDRRGVDRAGRRRPHRQAPRRRLPAAGHDQGCHPLPAPRRRLRRLGPAHLDRRGRADRVVETAGAGPEGRLRRHLRGALAEGATSLSYILHKGDEKDLPSDQSLDLAAHGHEVWRLAGKPGHLLPATGGAPDLDLTKAEAQWIDRDTVVWKVKATAATSQQLVYAPGAASPPRTAPSPMRGGGCGSPPPR